jgi:hypothetical protein
MKECCLLFVKAYRFLVATVELPFEPPGTVRTFLSKLVLLIRRVDARRA